MADQFVTEIHDTMKCIWCGGVMKRTGKTILGCCTNAFTMWCEDCGGIAHFARDPEKPIKSFEILYIFKESDNETD